jgi:putative hydrolase of the HAD superfamily
VNPKTVFFDVDGVLLHAGDANGRSSQPWFANLQRDLGVDPARLSERFFAPRTNEKSLMEACSCGQAAIGDVLPSILVDLGYQGNLESFLSYWFEHEAYIDQAFLNAVAILRDRHGYECYLATSQEHRRAAYIWDVLKMKDHFSGMYYSAQVGHSKNSAEFFHAIASDFDFKVVAPVYFDDRIAFVRVAAAAGWDSWLYETIDSLRLHPRLAGGKL